jgi:hypothetical protein
VRPSLFVSVYAVTDLPDWIAAQIKVYEPTQCWRWTGRHNPDGYGWIGREGAHRYVYRLLIGEIPVGLVIDHVRSRGCVFRDCLNVSHMEPVTNAANILRGDSFSARNARKTHCDNGHPFDLANTYAYKGRRDCRSCGRLRVRASKQRQRVADQGSFTFQSAA